MNAAFQIEDTCITVQPAEPETQQILLQATPLGRRLAQLLADDETPDRQNGFFVVAHTAGVDARLCALVDALTAVRWAHPTYTQLVLALPEAEGGGEA